MGSSGWVWTAALLCAAPTLARAQDGGGLSGDAGLEGGADIHEVENAQPAASAPAGDESSEMDLFALESQMTQSVASATKTEQRGAQAPAVITVVTAEEIQAR